MDRDFEKLSRKLEEANIHDIVPSFDKGEGWQQLQSKLQQREKRRVLPLWTRYGAAAAIGLLLGSLFMKQWGGSADTAPQVIVKEVRVAVPEKPVIINKPAVEQEVEHINKQQRMMVAQSKTEKPVVQPAQVQHTELKEPPAEMIAATKLQDTAVLKTPEEKEVMVAEAPPLKPKVIHLLDINNEDRQTVLNEEVPESSQLDVLLKQSTYTHTMSPHTTEQPILLRKVLNK